MREGGKMSGGFLILIFSPLGGLLKDPVAEKEVGGLSFRERNVLGQIKERFT